MNNKPFIKLGNKSFNVLKINYLEINDKELSVEIEIDSTKKKFKFKDQTDYNRFTSYIKLFSTEFETEVETIDQSKNLLKD